MTLGPLVGTGGTRFSVWSPDAAQLWLCLFGAGDRESRVPMLRDAEGVWHVELAGAGVGTRYGLRADGAYDPGAGLWFDPDKLLIDPYARAVDRPFLYDPMLAARRGHGADTAPLMPKGMVMPALPPLSVPPPALALRQDPERIRSNRKRCEQERATTASPRWEAEQRAGWGAR